MLSGDTVAGKHAGPNFHVNSRLGHYDANAWIHVFVSVSHDMVIGGTSIFWLQITRKLKNPPLEIPHGDI